MTSGIAFIERVHHDYSGKYLISTDMTHMVFDSGREAVVTRYTYADGHCAYSAIGGSVSTKWGPLHRFGSREA